MGGEGNSKKKTEKEKITKKRGLCRFSLYLRIASVSLSQCFLIVKSSFSLKDSPVGQTTVIPCLFFNSRTKGKSKKERAQRKAKGGRRKNKVLLFCKTFNSDLNASLQIQIMKYGFCRVYTHPCTYKSVF